MKKGLRYFLLFTGIIITLSGCSKTGEDKSTISSKIANETNNDKDTQENETIDANKESDAFGEKYNSYNELISEYMNNFKNQYINTDTMETNISTVTGEMNLKSTEGNSAIKYLDPEGKVLRYNITIYGETGKNVTDYYILENKLYVVELQETYSSPILGVGESDVLCYDLKKYIIDGNELYCLDDTAKNIITVSKKDTIPFITLEELNSNFKQSGTEE